MTLSAPCPLEPAMASPAPDPEPWTPPASPKASQLPALLASPLYGSCVAPAGRREAAPLLEAAIEVAFEAPRVEPWLDVGRDEMYSKHCVFSQWRWLACGTRAEPVEPYPLQRPPRERKRRWHYKYQVRAAASLPTRRNPAPRLCVSTHGSTHEECQGKGGSECAWPFRRADVALICLLLFGCCC